LGTLVLDDLEKMARVLGVKVVELFISPGRTAVDGWSWRCWRGRGINNCAD
jgi:hypothetical protein